MELEGPPGNVYPFCVIVWPVSPRQHSVPLEADQLLLASALAVQLKCPYQLEQQVEAQVTMRRMESDPSPEEAQQEEVPATSPEAEGADELELLLEAVAQKVVAQRLPHEEARWQLVLVLLQHPVHEIDATMPCTVHSSCS